MQFKLDENFSPDIVSLFTDQGHDADTVFSEELSGAPDILIYEVCRKLARTLVTLDLDFSNPLRFTPAATPGIMIIRPARPSLGLIRTTVKVALEMLKSRSIEGELWIVELNRIRVYSPSSPAE